MPYFKFLRETDRDNHAVLKSCIEGNIKFSLFSEMKDQTETCNEVDKKDVRKTLNAFFKNFLIFVKLALILPRQIVLVNRIYSNISVLFNVLKNSPELRLLRTQSHLKKLSYLIAHYLPIMLEVTNRDIQTRIGILCITKKINDKRMWEEYADKAKGFVVEYRDLNSVFTGDCTGVFDKITKVNYVEGKRRLPLRLSACDFDRLFFTKLKDEYGFEKEYRVIKVLRDCNNENGNYFIKINPEKYISRIIVGYNNTSEEIKEIRNYVKEHSSIPVVQAIANGNQIEIKQLA